MNWAASSAPSAADVRHVVLGNLAAMVISLVIALVRQLTSGTAQPTGWVNVGIFLVFTVLFAYLYFSRASEPARERSAMRDAMGR
jgi:chromate transport protein ChrA